MKKSLLIISFLLFVGISQSFSYRCLPYPIQQNLSYQRGLIEGASDARWILYETFYQGDCIDLFYPENEDEEWENNQIDYTSGTCWITTQTEYNAFYNFVIEYRMGLSRLIRRYGCSEGGYFNRGILVGFNNELCRLEREVLEYAYNIPGC